MKIVFALVLAGFLFNGCTVERVPQGSKHAYKPGLYTDDYIGVRTTKVYIGTDLVLKSISSQARGSLLKGYSLSGTNRHGWGGDIKMYSLLGLDKIVVQNGYLDGKYVVAKVTFYYLEGYKRDVGSLVGVDKAFEKVYDVNGRSIKTYDASSKNGHLSYLKFHIANR